MEIEEARRVLRIEAQAILDAVEKLGQNFVSAVDLMIQCKGKVVVTGMGKSGLVGRKISSTLSSTGTPSLFLHPAESSHGDLGVLSESDVVLAISYSGEATELASILNFVARKNIHLISMTAVKDSTLGKAGLWLDIGVKEEACPLGLAPTASSTVTMALGDAIAMALLRRRGFKREDFAEYHPSGRLGRRLLIRVKDIMNVGEAMPIVKKSDPMTKVLTFMTTKQVRGVAGVIDENGDLCGVITDGDIRRRLEKSNQPFTEVAADLMSKNPKTIDQSEFAERALFLMEQFSIQSLFVLDKTQKGKKPVGEIHLQDLLKANIR
jgi:arabinose-5-phosphate isomerase